MSYTFEKLDSKHHSDLTAFIQKHGQQYCRTYIPDAVSHVVDGLYVHAEKHHALGTGEVMISKFEDELVGLVAFGRRDWDSRCLGYPVAAIDYFIIGRSDAIGLEIGGKLVRRASEALGQATRFISAKVAPLYNITSSLESNGYNFIGTDLLLYRDLRDDNKTFFRNDVIKTVRFFIPDDLPTLIAIARKINWPGRFTSDPQIDRQAIPRLHAQWMRDAAADPKRSISVLAMDDGRVVGFIISRFETAPNFKGEMAHQELVGIDPELQGKGLGKILYRGVLQQMIEQKDIMYVTTVINANNPRALNAQLGLGFKVESAMCVYHKFNQ